MDAFASHFWMFLFEGRKRWTFFPRSAVNRLEPMYAESMDPVFEANIDSAGELISKLWAFCFKRLRDSRLRKDQTSIISFQNLPTSAAAR